MNSNTDKLKCFAGLLLLGCFVKAAQGADVMLRERAVPSKSVVYLGDVADIAAASRGEVDRLTNISVCRMERGLPVLARIQLSPTGQILVAAARQKVFRGQKRASFNRCLGIVADLNQSR